MVLVFNGTWNNTRFKLLKGKQNHTRVKQVLHLKEADEVGEDEEGGGAIDPLQEAEEDEGTPVDDEPRGEDRLHSPY